MYAFFISALVALGSSRSTWRAFTMGAPPPWLRIWLIRAIRSSAISLVSLSRGGGGSRAPEQMRASGARGGYCKLYSSVRTHGLVHPQSTVYYSWREVWTNGGSRLTGVEGCL